MHLLLLLFSLLLSLSSSTLTWVRRSPMLFPRSDIVAISTDSKIYVLGGCNGNQSTAGGCPSVTSAFTAYDFIADTWSVLTPAPRPRYRYMAALLGSTIYYIGGRFQNDSVVKEVDVYDILTSTWSTLYDQGNVTAISDGAAFSIGSKVYVSGGYDEVYNTLNGTIVLDTAITGPDKNLFLEGKVANKRVSGGDNGAVAIGNYGYVFGGWGGIDNALANYCSPLDTVERYDPSNNTWKLLSPLVHARGDMAFAVIGDFIFVMGGETKDASCNESIPTAEVEYLSIDVGTWIDLTPIEFHRFRFSGATWGDGLFDLGGQGAVDHDHYPVEGEVYMLNVTSIVNPVEVVPMPAIIPMPAHNPPNEIPAPTTTPIHTPTAPKNPPVAPPNGVNKVGVSVTVGFVMFMCTWMLLL